MNLSKFTHELDLGEHVALWHSIRLNPVFLTKDSYNKLKNNEDLDNEIIDELIRSKIVLKSSNEDNEVIKLIQSKSPKPAVSLCYFILSETCNLACKYCFLGNNSELRKKFSALSLFLWVDGRQSTIFNKLITSILFYLDTKTRIYY